MVKMGICRPLRGTWLYVQDENRVKLTSSYGKAIGQG
jgi:hypothetical protein